MPALKCNGCYIFDWIINATVLVMRNYWISGVLVPQNGSIFESDYNKVH